MTLFKVKYKFPEEEFVEVYTEYVLSDNIKKVYNEFNINNCMYTISIETIKHCIRTI